MLSFTFLTARRYLISVITFLLGVPLFVFIAEIIISSLGRTRMASSISATLSIALIPIIIIPILLFLYSLSLRCTFNNNRIIFKKGFKTYIIDASEGELLDIYIENINSSYPYYRNIAEDHVFENNGLMENKGLYAPNSWHVVFVTRDTLRHKKISCIHPANTDYVALEYRRELIPILENLLPYCKNQRKKEKGDI